MPRAIVTADPVDVFVGERLRAARLTSGLSQADLGKAMNLSFQQVQKYERGTNRISASMLVRAGKALGVPVSDFFPDDDIRLKDESVDIRTVRGGAALAEYFATMDSAQRVILLQVAQEFARSAR
ncbi:MAG: helix-turn-helix transcriptional regulator [Brevundimonas sp.]|uniref:helix-turn-helix domain-containing protein n=1 Tax=Brevundimonas sp. TaxID=1871086 RepID=UPI00260DB182|nr:helix-turn-helix transcriptional regulator [Brevundimonas sp.]MDI6623325.1 helix-turn-helix transcriptional regulator [Brevundimonas sp.]MDQ7812754.1 helix-turn-helix transcriptional regulator [Brevundimonas sp.]